RGMIEFEVTVPGIFSDGDEIHGGLFTILLDTILATAAWSRMDTFQPLATINLKTDFFIDAKSGDVMLFRATCQSIEDDVAFCQGMAFGPDGKPVAQADGTFMVGTTSPAVKGSRL
ncbi:MAG: PaaI family thioesterase, partial [Pseudomonadota bacterium]